MRFVSRLQYKKTRQPEPPGIGRCERRRRTRRLSWSRDSTPSQEPNRLGCIGVDHCHLKSPREAHFSKRSLCACGWRSSERLAAFPSAFFPLHRNLRVAGPHGDAANRAAPDPSLLGSCGCEFRSRWSLARGRKSPMIRLPLRGCGWDGLIPMAVRRFCFQAVGRFRASTRPLVKLHKSGLLADHGRLE